MELKGQEPFNTAVGAARNDTINNLAAINEAKAASPETWQALRIGRYWDGAVTLAVLKPDSLKLETMVYPFIGDNRQELLPGPNVVSVLLYQDSDFLEMRFDDQSVKVEIRDL